MSLAPAPAELAHLTDIIGEEATLALIEARGGTRIYVPREMNQASALAREIGLESARRLSEHLGGEYLKVPVCKYWRARIYRSDGLSYAQIARKLGCTETTVWRLLHPKGDDGQLLLL